MKLVLISDTHNQHDSLEIPDGDVLIHSGDACSVGTMAEFMHFASWFQSLPHPHKIYVPGNHDCFVEHQLSLARSLLPSVHFLVDDLADIEGVRFYGSPWTPRYGEWSFMLQRNGSELSSRWARIPDDTDVLITHGPPFGILDGWPDPDKHVGCELLHAHVTHRVEPRLHVFGHIHPSHGMHREGRTLYVNAAICDDFNEVAHSPIVLDGAV